MVSGVKLGFGVRTRTSHEPSFAARAVTTSLLHDVLTRTVFPGVSHPQRRASEEHCRTMLSDTR